MTAAGAVLTWGDNREDQTTVPQGLGGVTAIAAGYEYTAALLGSPVSLRAKIEPTQLILSWPTNSLGYTLQTTPNLNPPIHWSDYNQAPSVIDAENTVTHPITHATNFFRLWNP